MKFRLTATAVRNAKPKPDGKANKLTDGGGLYLLVSATGKYWRYDYTHSDKRKTLAIGIYPDISLQQARELHQQARSLLAQGVDPSQNKQDARAAKRAKTEHTFEVIAREWHTKDAGKWSNGHSVQILTRLERDVFPCIGNAPITEITIPTILKCLRAIQDRGAVDTAHRVKTDIGQVFRYAVATGRATHDPTPTMKGALKEAKGKHFPAITDPNKVGQLLRDIADYCGELTTISALQLCAYLFQRPGEIRQMEWTEINTEKALWEIPAAKMKLRENHLVPLPHQALAILEELKPLTGRYMYVFPAKGNVSKPMNKNTLPEAIHSMGYDKDTMTAHGFRAMARTIIDEVLGIRETYIELQLSHTVRDTNGRAYNRATHMEERTRMMQQWADYLDTLRRNNSNVTSE